MKTRIKDELFFKRLEKYVLGTDYTEGLLNSDYTVQLTEIGEDKQKFTAKE